MVPSEQLFLRLYINDVANWLSLLMKCQKVKSSPRNDNVVAIDLSSRKYLNGNVPYKFFTSFPISPTFRLWPVQFCVYFYFSIPLVFRIRTPILTSSFLIVLRWVGLSLDSDCTDLWYLSHMWSSVQHKGKYCRAIWDVSVLFEKVLSATIELKIWVGVLDTDDIANSNL